MSKKNSDIDIVLTWVDGNDPSWLREYSKYSGKNITDIIRYEDTGVLKYIFRGIEIFMPWVRKIHFVTFDQKPEWLKAEHPKLNMVSHSDIFPDNSVLPTFNAHAIEMNFHRIKGLSERFIYFNDDMLVMKPLAGKYFYTNGLPNDFYQVTSLFHDSNFSHFLHSNMQLINNELKKSKGVKTELSKVLNLKIGFRKMVRSSVLLIFENQIPLLTIHHHPQPHLKSNFIEVEESYPDLLTQTRGSRFRQESNLTPYVFRFWGLIKGKYFPKYNKDACYVGVNNIDSLTSSLRNACQSKPAFVCINEESGFQTARYSEYKDQLHVFFSKKFPEKSSFEE